MAKQTKEDLASFFKTYTVVPYCRSILMDTETPLSVFMKTVSPGDDGFLLESVEPEESIGRYTFIGMDPILKVDFSKDMLVATDSSGTRKSPCGKDIFIALRRILKEYTLPDIPGMPLFCCGLVGGISYDVIRYIEPVTVSRACDTGFSDMSFMLPRIVICFDHVTQSAAVVYNMIRSDGSFKEAYTQAEARVDTIVEQLRKPLSAPVIDLMLEPSVSVPESAMTKEEFTSAVKRAKEYIHEGDIIQVVLSQRFSCPLETDPLSVYRVLRHVNPSPYMFYLCSGGRALLGSSPEVFVKNNGRNCIIRPIAGTRHRGTTHNEDRELGKELLADPKERAEHLMLVDLARNDLGRVCEAGSVTVPEFMVVERYSHVMHIVSQVEGALKKDLDSFDLFMSSFPAGTVSGAPKVRAMQIIDELEKTRRGPYAGAVGYFSCNGSMDMAITIRTILVENNTAFIQAGAGIVADSDEDTEYQETINKAKALFKAIAIASVRERK